MLLKVTGACALLLVSVACKSSYALASGGTYSWKTTQIVEDPKNPYETHESAVTVTRDGNKVTIYRKKGRIVGTLEGDKFSGTMEPDGFDVQGTLTGNNRLEGTLTGPPNNKVLGTVTWTLESGK